MTVGWIEQPLVRQRTDSSRGELDVKFRQRSCDYLASPAERPIHLRFSRVSSQPMAAASTSATLLARLLETEPIVLPHCEFMEIRHIKQW
jgi:hypothetical protein